MVHSRRHPLTNAAQLVSEGAKAIVAPCDFDFGGPANREAQKGGIVGVSTCASSPLHGSVALGDKQFTLSMWNTTMGAAGAEFALGKGWKNAYVVTDTFIDYTTSLSDFFTRHFKAKGGHIIFEDKYTQGAQDFSAQLARLQRSQEKPDVLWERPDLERFYARLEDEYELKERADVLTRKLTVISDSAKAFADIIDTERSLRLELIIVVLIAVEIILAGSRMFLR
jgi:hypothetical protein